MRTLRPLLLCLTALAGCTSDHFSIDPEFRPLQEIRERPAGLGGGDTTITTVGTVCYVIKLDTWLATFPPGSVDFRSKMLHEQVHAVRQAHNGLLVWLAHYETDTDFMLKEEELGYYAEIMALRAAGLPVNVDDVANTMKDYSNLKGRMVSFAVARQWVLDVISGTWRP